MLPRVVLDTNVLISALLFSRGGMSWLRQGWQDNRFLPLIDRNTAGELIHVLNYPKFKLTTPEQELLLADFLPYAQVITEHGQIESLPELRDVDDTKFLKLAVSGRADILVSGDKDILEIKDDFSHALIKTPSQFRLWIENR